MLLRKSFTATSQEEREQVRYSDYHQPGAWPDNSDDGSAVHGLAVQEHTLNVLNVKGKPHLTSRERKLLALLASGLDNGEIASALKETEPDVVASVCRLLAKTSTRDRIELALFGLANSQAEPQRVKSK